MDKIFDFAQATLKDNSTNNVDIFVSQEMNLNAFTEQRASTLLESYKKSVDYKERVIFMYFIKALFAYQACLKMYKTLQQKDTIVGLRIDSEIITNKKCSAYVREINKSLYDSLIAIEFIAGDKNIFFRIIDNSTLEFTEKMTSIAYKLGVEI